jgi:hypothetical protein
VLEDLDSVGGESGCVDGEDGAREVAEAGAEVLARLQPRHRATGHVDAVEQEDLGVEAFGLVG